MNSDDNACAFDGNQQEAKEAVCDPVSMIQAYLEELLRQTHAENTSLETELNELEEKQKRIIDQKAETMCRMSLPIVGENSIQLMPNLEELTAKENILSSQLSDLVKVKQRLGLAYADHCQKAIQVTEGQGGNVAYDEFTSMSYEDLKKLIKEDSMKLSEMKRKSAESTDILRSKRKEQDANHKAVLEQISILELVALEAFELANEVKVDLNHRNDGHPSN
ncbi:uncharacterized protein LOC121405499 [Drosophila obscura]|uniref:uncharacterized protein LOC111081961 n=1 Tax=Drosophila obscura TaxID=7282 RepID=UPI001BB2B34E|nr:uncharacterized protein LOC111081961 [Drosophila obscura]XP_041452174.1 uncharacterized protein LOC121405499 [Drosophila obscura]